MIYRWKEFQVIEGDSKFDVDVFGTSGVTYQDYFVLLRNGQKQISSNINRVDKSNVKQVGLSAWQREYLNVEVSTSLDVAFILRSDCVTATKIEIELPSEIFSNHSIEEIQEQIVEGLDGHPIVSGDLKKIWFHDLGREVPCAILNVLPEEQVAIVQKYAPIQFMIRAVSMTRMIHNLYQQADKFIASKSFRHLNDFQSTLGDVVRQVDVISKENEEMKHFIQGIKEAGLEHGTLLWTTDKPGKDDTEKGLEIIVATRQGRYTTKIKKEELPAEEGREALLAGNKTVVSVSDFMQEGETGEVLQKLVNQDGQQRKRLMVLYGNINMVVECSSRLNFEALSIGELVRIDPINKVAFEALGQNPRGETAEVINLIPGNGQNETRLLVQISGVEMVVTPVPALISGEEPVEIGDLVRMNQFSKLAYEKIGTHDTGRLEFEQVTLEDVPDVTYEDIGGLEDEIQKVQDAIELPYLNMFLYRKYNLQRPKGILLFGPPGCGKTMIAKAMANGLTRQISDHLEKQRNALEKLIEYMGGNESSLKGRMKIDSFDYEGFIENCVKVYDKKQELGAILEETLKINKIKKDDLHAFFQQELEKLKVILKEEDGGKKNIKSFFLNVKGPELLTKWVGESELKIRKIFEIAKKKASFSTPVIIFFDEMEALFRKRGSGRSSDVEMTIVPQFLSEMDGVEEYSNVIVVGATNRHELLDPAIKRSGRLDVKILIGRPKSDQAREIFLKYFYIGDSRDKRILPLGEKEVEKFGSADKMIESLVQNTLRVLYSSRSFITVETDKGAIERYLLSDIVSGALIRAIVSRASQYAIKKDIGLTEDKHGITADIFYRALIDEITQNKDHLIENLPNLEGEGFDIKLHLEELNPDKAGFEIEKWDEPKPRPYLKPVSG